ncbi:MAG: DinB family protein [Crocinitomicaceae bacterium]|nr:DinB family protein [Crocinitomicaceae bacterium]
MTTTDLIQITTRITQANIELVNSYVKKMSESQLNWKPATSSWSIKEVLAHLNEYSNYYHPVFVKKIENTRFTSTKEAFVSSPLGRSAWKSMKLGNARNIKRKFKAPKDTNPIISPNLMKGEQVGTFLRGQNELLSIIDDSTKVNIRRVKIPISISKVVRLRLGDALLFVVYHNERHMQQILNLKNSPNFPIQ